MFHRPSVWPVSADRRANESSPGLEKRLADWLSKRNLRTRPAMRGLAPKVRDGQLITIPHSGKSCGNLARLIYLVNRDCRYDHVNATTEATRFNHTTLQVRYISE